MKEIILQERSLTRRLKNARHLLDVLCLRDYTKYYSKHVSQRKLSIPTLFTLFHSNFSDETKAEPPKEAISEDKPAKGNQTSEVSDGNSKQQENKLANEGLSKDNKTTSDSSKQNEAAVSNGDSASKPADTEVKKFDESDVELGEKVYKEEIAENGDVMKLVYRSSPIQSNVTLRSAIDAGKFDDRGKVDSMDDCVKICGETTSCDVAFMLSQQCFTVHCNSLESCQTKPAFSNFYNPQLAFVKHRVISKHKNVNENKGGMSYLKFHFTE